MLHWKLSLRYVAFGLVLGAAYEYALIKAKFYDHLRLSESRKRAEERDAVDAAVERLARAYPDKFPRLRERWEFLKQYEDALERGESPQFIPSYLNEPPAITNTNNTTSNRTRIS